jgi:hypothetical protein
VTAEFVVKLGLIPSDDAIEVLHCNNIPSDRSRCPYKSGYALLSVACTNFVEPEAVIQYCIHFHG